MKEIILIKYGEIILKGLNRRHFEDLLLKNIRKSVGKENIESIKTSQAITYLVPKNCDDLDDMIEKLKKVFGIVSIVRAGVIEKSMEALLTSGADYITPILKKLNTFKVETRRSDKRFPKKSPEISALMGGALLEKNPSLKVNVQNPDAIVRVEVREESIYVYSEADKVMGTGGMPTGSNGRATLLLSGGIDSPVAGYMLAKRGVTIDAVHFFSAPYTSERAKEKVIELAKIVATYTGPFNLYIIPFTEQQLAIKANCPEEHLTLIMRRMMMMSALLVAKKHGSNALITGESLGQVASQTIHALAVTDSVCDMPVFRPLIGMDKEEIVEIARKIGTFETSILPYEDCCTIFVPKHPTTKPTVEKIEKSEQNLDMEGLVQKAADETYFVRINP